MTELDDALQALARSGQNGLACPSGHPAMPGFVFARRDSTAEPWGYHEHLVWQDSREESLNAVRVAAPCLGHRCPNHEDARCGVTAIVVTRGKKRPHVVPDCAIRPTCRWFAEAGVDACRGCDDFEHWAVKGT